MSAQLVCLTHSYSRNKDIIQSLLIWIVSLLCLSWLPDGEPVNVRVRRYDGHVFDFVLARSDVHSAAIVGVYKNVLAERADPEQQRTEPVEWKHEGAP